MRARTIGLEVTGASGGEELVMCPFHDDHHASATWNPKHDLFYCFTCGIGMNLEQLLTKTGNKIDAELFYEDYDLPVDLDLSRDEPEWDEGSAGYSEYLKGRGISFLACQKYGINLADGGERIIFPSRNLDGKTEGIICRYIHPGSGPRYRKTGRMFPVWPMDRLVGLKHGEYIIITEGVFSALRIATVDATFKVFALSGAKANSDIVAALSPFNPIFLYDGDPAGKRAARTMKHLRPDWSVLISKPAPDDMIADEQIKKLIAKLLKPIRAKIK